MKQFWYFTAALLLISLTLFLFFEQAGIGSLIQPDALIQTHSLSAALIAVGLLITDVFLPIPSSLVMMVNGAIFGLAIGTTVSLIGCIGATGTAFLIGKRSRSWVIDRFVSADQMEKAQQLFERWGVVALIITRPIPLLAETAAIIAGTSGIGYRAMLGAALAGSLPAAFLYAFTGSTALQFNSTLWSFGLVLLISLFFGILPNILSTEKQ